MPLAIYRVAHREARLDAAEKARLIAGLVATFGVRKPGEPDEDDD